MQPHLSDSAQDPASPVKSSPDHIVRLQPALTPTLSISFLKQTHIKVFPMQLVKSKQHYCTLVLKGFDQ